MKRFILLGLIVSSVFMFNPKSFAQTVDEIITKANLASYYAGNDGRSQVTMTITDSQSRIRTRGFQILRMDVQDGGEQKYYVYFSQPADVQDMVYMVWKYTDKDDDRWMYLPALDLVRRIAATDTRSSFVGSNFVYEDISGRNLDLDTHELLASPTDVYIIKNTPKDAGSVEFSYYMISIRKDNFLPVKAEYFDKQRKLSRVVEALEIKDIQGYASVTKSKATDLANNSNTVIDFSNIKYDLGLEADIFSERYLRRPPRKWLDQ
ncbi:MAG: outer membrane lipoprotein-sorting protein [Candidatus Omnitrophica bacterium]|nr:outer membrane lipoprotein-sorting protein [Candidatus Omnitrophota bacterium]